MAPWHFRLESVEGLAEKIFAANPRTLKVLYRENYGKKRDPPKRKVAARSVGKIRQKSLCQLFESRELEGAGTKADLSLRDERSFCRKRSEEAELNENAFRVESISRQTAGVERRGLARRGRSFQSSSLGKKGRAIILVGSTRSNGQNFSREGG